MSMKIVTTPKNIEPWRIICAAQSEPDYNEDRQILLYGGDADTYYQAGPFILLDGGHCSCYDWEEVEWDATEYDYDELVTLAKSKADGKGCFYESEQKFWQLVLHAVVPEDA